MSIRSSGCCALLAAFALLAVTGCNGCRPSPLVERDEKAPDLDELEKKKKEKEKAKEDFEFKPAIVVPGEPEEMRLFVKPGHWVTVRHLVKANNFDFQAELHTHTTDSTGQPIEVENTPFYISASRPAPLPKGQEKAFETTYHIPVVKQTDPLMPKSAWLQRELRAARGGRLVKEDVRQGTVPMPTYQYHFVILSDEPSRFGYMKSLTAFTTPTSTEADTDKLTYYRVQAPKIDRFAPVPNHFLTWTSIAFILWDDVNPQIMTPAQQVAMIDWLHYGGQLLISGPNSIEKLRGSFLEPYLPVSVGSTREIAQGAIEELNAHWAIRDGRTGEVRSLNVLPDKPLTGVELTPRGSGASVPNTGSLVYEGRVGNGRIAVTSFSLGDPKFLNWRSIDSFVNGALLRRPPRLFRMREAIPDTEFVGLHPSLAKDSRMSSTLRLFSRDISTFTSSKTGEYEPVISSEDQYPGITNEVEALGGTVANMGMGAMPVQPYRPNMPAAPTGRDLHPDIDDWRLRGYWSGWRSSMAAWNDRSGASNAARQSLKDAAGISIPKGEFVLKVLAAYLAILAPLNWVVFRLLGRVELAWVSAPIIAIVGTFAVVRLAQLDIGFARSLTEIAIVEAHGNYSRAHATRYSALYTSLSTTYDLEFAEDGALALPFAAGEYQRGLHDSLYGVTLKRDKQFRLSGFMVPSNTTGTMHCEQVLDLGGSFSLVPDASGGIQLQNSTGFGLRNAGVLRRTERGNIEVAWVGELRPKATVPLSFGPAPENRPHLPQWDDAVETRSYETQMREILAKLDADQDGKINRRESGKDPLISEEFSRIDHSGGGKVDQLWDRDDIVRYCRVSRAGEVSLGQLYELASKALRLGLGEVRLIGWTEEELPGVKIEPVASQRTHRTLFLVHLRPGSLPVPSRDANLVSDLGEIKPDNAEDFSAPGDGSTAVPKL